MEQHEVPVVHVEPIGLHADGPPPPPSAALTGGAWDASQAPFVQLDVQQSAPVLQAPWAAVQTVVHCMLAGSQCAEQQSASAVHEAF